MRSERPMRYPIRVVVWILVKIPLLINFQTLNFVKLFCLLRQITARDTCRVKQWLNWEYWSQDKIREQCSVSEGGLKAVYLLSNITLDFPKAFEQYVLYKTHQLKQNEYSLNMHGFMKTYSILLLQPNVVRCHERLIILEFFYREWNVLQ